MLWISGKGQRQDTRTGPVWTHHFLVQNGVLEFVVQRLFVGASLVTNPKICSPDNVSIIQILETANHVC